MRSVNVTARREFEFILLGDFLVQPIIFPKTRAGQVGNVNGPSLYKATTAADLFLSTVTGSSLYNINRSDMDSLNLPGR